MSEESKPWALVTGASAGIGKAFARALAARRQRLVLTARREDRLRELADELKAQYGTTVEIIAADLAVPDAALRLFDELMRRQIHVDTLINNAGYGVPGPLLSQSWQTHAQFIQVLMCCPVELCYRLLPGMLQRGHGRIINVASLAGFMPGTAGHTLYAASKASLIKFSQSLALECQGRGVNVCALCPGFTWSEFHDVTGAREKVSRMPRWMWMTADDVARQGLDAVERGDIVYVNGRVNRIIKFIGKHLPDSWALKLIAWRSKDFRVQE